jgi:molybdenum cofactor biosynthesis enzyme MoaA
MNTQDDVTRVSTVDELSLLIDCQVREISAVDGGLLVAFIDGRSTLVDVKIPAATAVIASFVNTNLRGIPSGFDEVLNVIDGGELQSLQIESPLHDEIKVTVSRKDGFSRSISLWRRPNLVSPSYSLSEFLDEVGPRVQRFATGRSLAPLPRSVFRARIRHICQMAADGCSLDDIIALPPLLITIGVTDLCNFKCEMCFRTRKGYVPGRFIFPDEVLRNLVLDMGQMGMKALRFCGEGENMLHPKFFENLMLAKVVGLNTFMITNGTVLPQGYRIVSRCLDYLRVSFNALSPQEYRKVHGISSEETYFRVLEGLTSVRQERERLTANLPIVSISSVVCESSIDDALKGRLAEDLVSIGLDLVVMKNDRIWELDSPQRDKYRRVIENFQSHSIRVVDYGGITNPQAEEQRDWENELGLGCIVRLMRANIDRFDVHSCVIEHEVYGVITQQRLPEIWASAQRAALQHKRATTPLKACAGCFWGDFHRIMNFLFDQEMRGSQ